VVSKIKYVGRVPVRKGDEQVSLTRENGTSLFVLLISPLIDAPTEKRVIAYILSSLTFPFVIVLPEWMDYIAAARIETGFFGEKVDAREDFCRHFAMYLMTPQALMKFPRRYRLIVAISKRLRSEKYA
jgi:hypothetical protein